MSDRQADHDLAEPSHTGLQEQETAVTGPTADFTCSHEALETSCSHGSLITGRQAAPRIIDLRHTDVDATWQNYRLPGVLGLYWDYASNACLRLQVSVNIKADPSLGHKLNIYLFVPPERIRQLTIVPGSHLFGTDTYTLDFVLSGPSFLIVPSQTWEPRDDMSKMASDLLHNLAGQMQFTLCTKIP